MDDSVARVQRAGQDTARQAQHPGVDRYIEQAAGIAVPRAGRVALFRLDEGGPLSISALAAACGVDVSTMSRTVRMLGDAGLVARGAADDLRFVRVSLTPEGGKAVGRLLLAAQALLGEATSGWKPDERERLAELLSRLSRDLGARLATAAAPGRIRVRLQ